MSVTSVLASLCPEAVRGYVAWRSPGASPTYRIDDRWSITHYTMATDIDLPQHGRQVRVEAGAVVLFAPGTVRRFRYRTAGWHRAVHIHIDLETDQLSPRHWPASPMTARVATGLDEIIQAGDERRRRAAAWWTLWLLSDLDAEQDQVDVRQAPAALAAVRRAQAHIARHLAGSMQVEDVVQAAGISHNHLLRCFRACHGMGIAAYIRTRRMVMAEELLRQSDLPIAVIAAEVGIPDRQHFNKTVRRHFGCPPSALRGR